MGATPVKVISWARSPRRAHYEGTVGAGRKGWCGQGQEMALSWRRGTSGPKAEGGASSICCADPSRGGA